MKSTKTLIGILLLLLGLSLHVEAQIGRYQNVRKFSGIKSTTTLIVLDDEETPYNIAMRAATSADRWTITPIKYIPRAELQPYLAKAEYSMLLKNNQVKVVRRAGGRNSNLKSNDVGLYRCNQGELNNYATIDAIAAIRLRDVTDEEAYVFKLTGLIKAMHHYLMFLDDKPVSPDRHDKMMEAYFNRNNADLAELSLMISESDVDDTFDPSRFYPHEVAVVEPSVIQEALLESQPGKAFLHMHPRNQFDMIISTETGQVLYYRPQKKPKPFSRKNLSAIAKKIKKAAAAKE